MERLAAIVVLATLASCTQSASPTQAQPAQPEAARHQAAVKVRPQVAGTCTLLLTAPSAYSRTNGANDTCNVAAAQTGAGITNPHDVFLFVARKSGTGGAMLPERSFNLGVDPTLTAGTTVALTLLGQSQLTDRVILGYDENTVETRCNHFVGSVTVVKPRPMLDVKFDVTCQEPSSGASGEHLVGELTSTL